MKYRFILGAFFISILSFSQSKKWSLQECITYAHENNLTVKSNELNLKTTDLAKDAATANLFPNLNFNGGYFWQFGLSIDPTTNTREPGSRQTSSYTVSSTWVIFDGLQNIKMISQARLDYMASVYNLEAIKNDISLSIASSYLQVLLNKQILEVAENQLTISESQLQRNKKLFEAGSIPKGDYLQAQAQLASDDQSVIAAQNNVTLSMLQLVQILQLDEYEDFDIVTPTLADPDNALLNYSPKQIYDIAIDNQPVIKSAELGVQSAETQVGISKGSYSPIVSLSGQVNSNYAQDAKNYQTFDLNQITTLTNESGSTNPADFIYVSNTSTFYDPTTATAIPFFDQFGNNLNQFVGVNVQIPIFNRFQIRNDVSNSKIALERAQVQLETQRNALRQTIERAYADALATLKSFKAAEKSLDANKENWEYAQKRYEQGAMNQFDYERTRNLYLNATAQLLQNKYDYIFKVKVLQFYLTNNITL
jgi:outer membrane protein